MSMLLPVLCSLFSQVTPRPWGLGDLLITVIVVGAVFAVAWIALRAMRVPIPDWAWQIVGIVIVCVVAVFAIKLLLSL